MENENLELLKALTGLLSVLCTYALSGLTDNALIDQVQIKISNLIK